MLGLRTAIGPIPCPLSSCFCSCWNSRRRSVNTRTAAALFAVAAAAFCCSFAAFSAALRSSSVAFAKVSADSFFAAALSFSDRASFRFASYRSMATLIASLSIRLRVSACLPPNAANFSRSLPNSSSCIAISLALVPYSFSASVWRWYCSMIASAVSLSRSTYLMSSIAAADFSTAAVKSSNCLSDSAVRFSRMSASILFRPVHALPMMPDPSSTLNTKPSHADCKRRLLPWMLSNCVSAICLAAPAACS